jgi:hypothetical protein
MMISLGAAAFLLFPERFPDPDLDATPGFPPALASLPGGYQRCVVPGSVIG